LRKLVNQSIN